MSLGQETKAKWVLAAGLASISFAAILVRYCAAPALAIGFYRKAFASVFLLPVMAARWKREPWDWAQQRRLWPYTLGAGVILGVHFACWIASIQLNASWRLIGI